MFEVSTVMRIERGGHANIVLWLRAGEASIEMPCVGSRTAQHFTPSASVPALEFDNVLCLQLDHSYADGKGVS